MQGDATAVGAVAQAQVEAERHSASAAERPPDCGAQVKGWLSDFGAFFCAHAGSRRVSRRRLARCCLQMPHASSAARRPRRAWADGGFVGVACVCVHHSGRSRLALLALQNLIQGHRCSACRARRARPHVIRQVSSTSQNFSTGNLGKESQLYTVPHDMTQLDCPGHRA